MLQEVGHRRTCFKILNQTPTNHRNRGGFELPARPVRRSLQRYQSACFQSQKIREHWTAEDEPRYHLNIVESWFVSDQFRRTLAPSKELPVFLCLGSLVWRSLSEHHMDTITMAPESKQAPPRRSGRSYLWCAACLPIGGVTLCYWARTLHQIDADTNGWLLKPHTPSSLFCGSKTMKIKFFRSAPESDDASVDNPRFYFSITCSAKDSRVCVCVFFVCV